MLEDRHPLSHQLLRVQWHGHFDLVRAPFLPRSTVEPDLTLRLPVVVLCLLTGLQHGLQANAMGAVRVGQVTSDINLMRPIDVVN